VPNCRNCELSIAIEILFCPHCGQKNTDGKIKVWSFLAVFLDQVFNIESKLFKTMRDVFIPGRLTVEYFKGKHKTYFHPLRFFIVLAVLLLAIIGFFLDNETTSTDNISQSFKYKIYNSVLFHQLDSLNRAKYQTQEYDTITYTLIQQLVDELVDETLGEYGGVSQHFSPYVYDFDTNKELYIKNIDLIELNDQEIVDKYKIEGFWEVLLLKQNLKVLKGESGFRNFFLSNVLWTGLLMMPFLALIFKLFYLKLNHYYVEHLVFSFHIHSFIFLLFAFIILLLQFLNFQFIFIISILAIPIYIVFAIKKVYRQSWSSTLLKFTGISFCYTILSTVFLALTLVLGLMFF